MIIRISMSFFGSPVKVSLSSAKKRKLGFDLDKCVICQLSTNEELSNFTGKGKTTLFDAVRIRKDAVYERFIEEYQSFDEIPVDNLKLVYHRSCYKSYTSKRNLQPFSGKNETELEPGPSFSLSHVKTRSQSPSINWGACLFCKNYTFKKNKKTQ